MYFCILKGVSNIFGWGKMIKYIDNYRTNASAHLWGFYRLQGFSLIQYIIFGYRHHQFQVKDHYKHVDITTFINVFICRRWNKWKMRFLLRSLTKESPTKKPKQFHNKMFLKSLNKTLQVHCKREGTQLLTIRTSHLGLHSILQLIIYWIGTHCTISFIHRWGQWWKSQ